MRKQKSVYSYFPSFATLKLLLSDEELFFLVKPDSADGVFTNNRTLLIFSDAEAFGLERASNLAVNSLSTLTSRGRYLGGPLSRSVHAVKQLIVIF